MPFDLPVHVLPFIDYFRGLLFILTFLFSPALSPKTKKGSEFRVPQELQDDLQTLDSTAQSLKREQNTLVFSNGYAFVCLPKRVMRYLLS